MSEQPRLLVIEDDLTFLRSITKSLLFQGYEVNPVSSGEEGVKEMRRDFHGAIVTDFRMQGLSGIDLIKTLRRENPDIPIIVMSGLARDEEIINSVNAIADSYLLKPFVVYELLLAIEQALLKCCARTSKTKKALYGEESV